MYPLQSIYSHIMVLYYIHENTIDWHFFLGILFASGSKLTRNVDDEQTRQI